MNRESHGGPSPAPDLEKPPAADTPPDPAPDETPDPEIAGPAPRRAFTLPDLHPYVPDRTTAAKIGTLAADITRTTVPKMRRGIRRGRGAAGRGFRRTLRAGRMRIEAGTAVMGVLVHAWFTGEIGRKVSPVMRLLVVPAITVYAVRFVVIRWPLTTLAAAVLVWPVAALICAEVAIHKDKIGQKRQMMKVSKAGEKRSLSDRLAIALAPTPHTPPAAVCDIPDDAAVDNAPETPAEDYLTAFLRELIGTENGIHLRDLRPAMRNRFPELRNATDEELRNILVQAGYNPARKFRARGAVGLAGVHRDNLPPLPSPTMADVPLSTSLSTSGDRLSPADSSRPESEVESSGEQQKTAPRIVHDPQRGPTAWRVEHDRG